MDSRTRLLTSLNHQTPDRTPRDLGGMRSTSISAFAYPRLVRELGLPPRLPRVEDTGQMLALPDLDVLDALGIDVVTILGGVTNAFDQPAAWHDYDFNGRLPARVLNPGAFQTLPDGTILQGSTRMPPSSFVFDDLHGGQPLDLSADLPKPDLDEVRKAIARNRLTDEKVIEIRDLCRRVHESTDRAVFFNHGYLQTWFGIGAFNGIGIFPMLCLTEPAYIAELHELVTEYTLANARLLLPEIAPYIDILMLAADDWGTQNNLIASPKVFRQLFLPYYRRINDECHRLAPQLKLFLHCCGAVYDLLDLVIEAGFDILNPVQWPAGGHSPQEWKDKARGRLALWGGGVNAQATLPLGSVDEVIQEARQTARILGEGGGYVFCNIHNILAEIAPEKVIALYQAASEA
jgi:uroporphyrinogen decarboxylase